MLFDGATGTELYSRGIFINRCFEEANLVNQDLVRTLHREYVEAGAQIITTNSWGANRLKLAGYNLQDRIGEIITAAVKLAREAAASEVYVAGSVGPTGVRLEPYGPTSMSEAREIFAEQARWLIKAGVDLVCLETFYDARELEQAILAVRDVSQDIPLIANMSVNLDGELTMGIPFAQAIKMIEGSKVDVIGLNCSVGPQPMLTVIEKMARMTKLPLCAQPNAGLPRAVEGRQIYMSTPEYMAEYSRKYVEAGVQFIGGCCGTSPLHIKAMAQTFRHQLAMRQATSASSSRPSPLQVLDSGEQKKSVQRVATGEKSHWSKKLVSGEKVTSIELLPPVGISADSLLEKARQAKNGKVDAINIPDGPRASSRMSAIISAIMIEQQVGIETVLHYTCRDRNLVGMQADMIGAHAIGLRNVLLLTGDPPKLGSYPNATGVFDIDAIGLVNMVHGLNGGADIGGRSIGEPTSLSIGVGVNPNHEDFEHEMNRFYYKVDAGAEWAITQPVFDPAALFRFLDYIEKKNLRIPIVIGIWPLVSLKNALFMKNEVPGVVVPDEIITRMQKAVDPESAKLVGIEIAQEMWHQLKDSVQGIQVSAPFGRIDLALKVMDLC
jgi:homocysteine S-methyltransferase